MDCGIKMKILDYNFSVYEGWYNCVLDDDRDVFLDVDEVGTNNLLNGFVTAKVGIENGNV